MFCYYDYVILAFFPIAGPPTAPDITMVNFTEPRVAFTIEWDGTAVVSASAVTGFQVNSPSGITCDDTSSSPSAMESRCTWEPSAVGQTHSICVSAINCGLQQGASDCANVTLQGKYRYYCTCIEQTFMQYCIYIGCLCVLRLLKTCNLTLQPVCSLVPRPQCSLPLSAIEQKLVLPETN